MEPIVKVAAIAGSATIIAAAINAYGAVKASKNKTAHSPEPKHTQPNERTRIRTRRFGVIFWLSMVMGSIAWLTSFFFPGVGSQTANLAYLVLTPPAMVLLICIEIILYVFENQNEK